MESILDRLARSRQSCVVFDSAPAALTILTGQFSRWIFCLAPFPLRKVDHGARAPSMQRPNVQKRQKIVETAERLFATRPFHKVRLDDVAAAANVGKGTLYIYFKSKEDLYASLVTDSFSGLLAQLKGQVDAQPAPAQALREIVRKLVGFAFDHPNFFEMIRTSSDSLPFSHLRAHRRQLTKLIAAVLESGNHKGSWSDPQPQLTAVLIPGMVRSAMMYGSSELDEQTLSRQILRLLGDGLTWKEP